MKRFYYTVRYLINPIPVAIIYLILGIALCYPLEEYFICIGLPPGEIVGEIDYIMLGKWIVVICAPLLPNGLVFENFQKIKLYSIMRTGGYRYFRFGILFSNLFIIILWGIEIFILACLTLDKQTATLVFVVITANSIMWNLINLVIYEITARASWSGTITIGLLAVSCLAGAHFPKLMVYLPSTWGMLCCSSIHGGMCHIKYMLLMSGVFSNISAIIFLKCKER